jgi:CheY-like chemotaxis protein
MMTERTLEDRCILVVEDEYFLADDLRELLADAGAEVLGPVASIAEANKLIASGAPIDAAVLDVNLSGQAVFPVADALQARNVPFVFTTGYDRWTLPDRFIAVPRLEKPLTGANLLTVIAPLADVSFHSASRASS